MEDLKKSGNPMTIREYLNTLDTEKFAYVIICAASNIECRYMDTELDAPDVVFSVEYDMIEWLNSPYCEGKELLPSKNIKINEDEFDIEDLDD